MRAADVRKRRHAQADQVRALPQAVPIDEVRSFGVFHRRVAAGDGVAGLFQLGEGIADPAPLGLPVGDRRHEPPLRLHLLVDVRVVGDLHLVDRHAVGRQLDGLPHAIPPVLLRLLHHAGDQVDVDLRELQLAGEMVGAADLARAVGPAVDLQDVIVEVLHAEAQARDANLPDDLELVVGQRAGLAFKRHLLGLVPAQDRLHPVGQVLELRLGQVGGRAAAEIDELRLAPADWSQYPSAWIVRQRSE